MNDLWRYWAKGKSATSQSPSTCHLLPFHLLDVAAVGRELLTKDFVLQKRLCHLLAVEPPSLLDLATFWLALHDCGKFADSFQGQLPDLYRKLLSRSKPKPPSVHHSDLGYCLWQESLSAELWDAQKAQGKTTPYDFWDFQDFLAPLARAALGHHGKPPTEVVCQDNTLADSFLSEDITVSCSWLGTISSLAPPTWLPSVLNQEDRGGTATASWLLAGLVVFCDWLGSNTEFFLARNISMDPREYLECVAAPQAKKALAATGAIPPPPRTWQGTTELFPGLPSLTPLQQEAGRASTTGRPQLFIIEDATGSGKTEAAMIWASKLIASGAGEGLFFALPTMATSNAMYDRMAEAYRRLFEPNSNPSLVLAHSSSRLHGGFLESRRGTMPKGAGSDVEGAAYCSTWLADNRKKALLAPVGVGTLDQALMGILPSRHQSLRLLGLGRNVLVVDEVHAYDPYMHQLLCTLLKFHAAFGGSAVLLSASLPQGMRQDLVDAFRQGGRLTTHKLQHLEYPLLTTSSDGEVREVPVAPWEQSRRDVKVKFLHDVDTVQTYLLDAVHEGGCACWIRNTVSDAVDAWEVLSQYLPADDLLLFHARFPMCDRLAIEQKVVELFGKQGTAAHRTGKLLIATQVVEQSLDIDFDVLVSDLAPVDLLIQRAGRLHRHERGDRGQPILAVNSPPLTDEPRPEWYAAQFPKGAYVYPDHGRLWLTAMLLDKAGKIRVPDNIRQLIEGVYGEESFGRIPDGLRASSDKATGRALSHSSLAQFNQLELAAGYADHGGKWLPDTETPTRLGERSTTLRLAKWDGSKLSPWCEHDDPFLAWSLSQVNAAYRWVASPTNHSQELAQAIEKALESMQDKGRWSVLVPMQFTEAGVWSGNALNPQGEPVQIHCDDLRGLQITNMPTT